MAVSQGPKEAWAKPCACMFVALSELAFASTLQRPVLSRTTSKHTRSFGWRKSKGLSNRLGISEHFVLMLRVLTGDMILKWFGVNYLSAVHLLSISCILNAVLCTEAGTISKGDRLLPLTELFIAVSITKKDGN